VPPHQKKNWLAEQSDVRSPTKPGQQIPYHVTGAPAYTTLIHPAVNAESEVGSLAVTPASHTCGPQLTRSWPTL